jgi:type IV pilus assembly protein PilN
MIKINLLPREGRPRGPVNVNTSILLAVVAVLAILAGMGYGWYWLDDQVGRLDGEIKRTEAELKRFEELAKQVDRFQGEKKRLEEKIKIIGSLMLAQTGPVRLLDEVSKALPNEVWLTSFSRTGKKMDVQGIAFSNFSLANFMTNLSNTSGLISSVDLVESVKATVEQVPVERFSITAEIKEPKG